MASRKVILWNNYKKNTCILKFFKWIKIKFEVFFKWKATFMINNNCYSSII